MQPVRGGWSPTNFKVGQPDQVRHKGLWVQSFWKRDSYQLDLAQISKCWTLKSKGAIDESRNLHLNSPPRLGLCIFLKILKTSLGSLDSMTLVQSISETSVHCTYVKLWLEFITRSSHLSVHTLTSARGQVIHNLPASQMLFKIFLPTKYCISVREHLLQRQKMRFRQICAVKIMHKCGLNYALMHKSSLTKPVSTLLQLLLSNSVSVLVMISEFFDKCQLYMGKDKDRSN